MCGCKMKSFQNKVNLRWYIRPTNLRNDPLFKNNMKLPVNFTELNLLTHELQSIYVYKDLVPTSQ
jgi:hypothetical protein